MIKPDWDYDILTFKGHYRWLSNFFPVMVEYDGIPYPTVEHAYQAAKTKLHHERQPLQYPSSMTAGEAKRYGRRVHIRDEWETIKLDVMKKLLEQKFETAEFRELLVATKDKLIVEGNTWGDVFWGAVPCKAEEGLEGDNHLGRIIMEIRDEILNSGRGGVHRK